MNDKQRLSKLREISQELSHFGLHEKVRNRTARPVKQSNLNDTIDDDTFTYIVPYPLPFPEANVEVTSKGIIAHFPFDVQTFNGGLKYYPYWLTDEVTRIRDYINLNEGFFSGRKLFELLDYPQLFIPYYRLNGTELTLEDLDEPRKSFLSIINCLREPYSTNRDRELYTKGYLSGVFDAIHMIPESMIIDILEQDVLSVLSKAKSNTRDCPQELASFANGAICGSLPLSVINIRSLLFPKDTPTANSLDVILFQTGFRISAALRDAVFVEKEEVPLSREEFQEYMSKQDE